MPAAKPPIPASLREISRKHFNFYLLLRSHYLAHSLRKKLFSEKDGGISLTVNKSFAEFPELCDGNKIKSVIPGAPQSENQY